MVENILTFLLSVLIGLLNVSPMCLFFGSFGLLKIQKFIPKYSTLNFTNLEGV